jgi:uncharacterized protein with PQ loop repeat
MTSYVTELVSWAFFAVNAGRIFAYLPQILAAAKCQNGAAAVSRATWSYFAFAHFTGAMYGLVVIHDHMMVIVFIGNFLACCVLVGLVSWKKWRHVADPVKPKPVVARMRATFDSETGVPTIRTVARAAVFQSKFQDRSPWLANSHAASSTCSAPEQIQ